MGILINSPSNPTGTVYKKEKLEQISNIDFPYILSDEVYHGLSYGNAKEHTMLEFASNAVVINGFSKLYAMTGWRLGYIIVPKDLIRPLQRLQQNYFISANSFVQWAGIAALKHTSEYITSMRDNYNKRRIYMLERLRSLGFTIDHEPEGAFYIFVNASHINPNSMELAFAILDEVHLGVAPGIDFGSNGEGYLRFSYATSMESIEVGLDRLEVFIKNHV
jgi:aspartate/methionine/tyrosine aminotransferase